MDPVFDSWFPYTENTAVYFTNGSERDTLIPVSYERSEGYTTVKCSNAYAHYMWRFASDRIQYMSVTASVGEDPSIYRIRIKNTDVEASGLDDVEGLSFPRPVMFNWMHPSKTLGSRVFAEVQELVMDTLNNKALNISHLYIAKNQGIVGFTSFPSGVLWVKQ